MHVQMYIDTLMYGHPASRLAFHFMGGSRGRVRGVRPPPPEMTCGFLTQLVFCQKKTMWFIGVEVEQETSAPSPEKNPGSAPAFARFWKDSVGVK